MAALSEQLYQMANESNNISSTSTVLSPYRNKQAFDDDRDEASMGPLYPLSQEQYYPVPVHKVTMKSLSDSLKGAEWDLKGETNETFSLKSQEKIHGLTPQPNVLRPQIPGKRRKPAPLIDPIKAILRDTPAGRARLLRCKTKTLAEAILLSEQHHMSMPTEIVMFGTVVLPKGHQDRPTDRSDVLQPGSVSCFKGQDKEDDELHRNVEEMLSPVAPSINEGHPVERSPKPEQKRQQAFYTNIAPPKSPAACHPPQSKAIMAKELRTEKAVPSETLYLDYSRRRRVLTPDTGETSRMKNPTAVKSSLRQKVRFAFS